MDEKIEIKKQDFYEMMYLTEKILYIAERSGGQRGQRQQRVFSSHHLWKENVVQELLSSLKKNG